MIRFNYKNHSTLVDLKLQQTYPDIVDECLDYILPYLEEYETTGQINPAVLTKSDYFKDFSHVFCFYYSGIRIRAEYLENELWPCIISLF